MDKQTPTQFNLSEKRRYCRSLSIAKNRSSRRTSFQIVITEKDVKEFIRLLKQQIFLEAGDNEENRIYLRETNGKGIFDIIDKLAGDKLI